MKLGFLKITAWSMCLIFIVGLSLSGTGYVLCIGDNGHIEFETSCMNCRGEAAEICKVNVSDDAQCDHSDCTNCSDVEIEDLFWSKRIQKTDSDLPGQFIPIPTIDTIISLISIENGDSRITKFHLAYGQSPPSYTTAITVLRC
ncbi:MAG: hypothetical protein GY839_11480 [candidate division Zixibacteria bacterium]|nr:hypothetical protein [candidate division Zixibacteria bacterium]